MRKEPEIRIEDLDSIPSAKEFKKHGREKFFAFPEEGKHIPEMEGIERWPTLEQIIAWLQAIHAIGTFNGSASVIKAYKVYKVMDTTNLLPIAAMILVGTKGYVYEGYDYQTLLDKGENVELGDFFTSLHTSTKTIHTPLDWASFYLGLQGSVPKDKWDDDAVAYMKNTDALLGSKFYDDIFPMLATVTGNTKIGLAFSIVNGIFSVAKGILDVVNPIIPILKLTKAYLATYRRGFEPGMVEEAATEFDTRAREQLEKLWSDVPESFKTIYGVPTLLAFQEKMANISDPVIDTIMLSLNVTLVSMETAKKFADPIYAPRAAVRRAWEKLAESGVIIFTGPGKPLQDPMENPPLLSDFLPDPVEPIGIEKKIHNLIMNFPDSDNLPIPEKDELGPVGR
jgi:hypothetical protein